MGCPSTASKPDDTSTTSGANSLAMGITTVLQHKISTAHTLGWLPAKAGVFTPSHQTLIPQQQSPFILHKVTAWLEELLALSGISSTLCFEQGNELSPLVFPIWDAILIYIHGNKGKTRGHLAQAAKLPGKPHPKALSPSPPSKHLLQALQSDSFLPCCTSHFSQQKAESIPRGRTALECKYPTHIHLSKR